MLAVNVEEEQLRAADRLSQLQYRCVRCEFLERRNPILDHCIQEFVPPMHYILTNAYFFFGRHGILNPTHSADYKLSVDGTFGGNVTIVRIRGTRSTLATRFV